MQTERSPNPHIPLTSVLERADAAVDLGRYVELALVIVLLALPLTLGGAA